MTPITPLPQRKSPRLRDYNYAQSGAYFVTICTQRREWLFGEVEDGDMHLSALGEIADRLWYKLPDHHSNVELDAFVVMPNHVHGIVVIHDRVDTVGDAAADDACVVPTNGDGLSVGTMPTSSAITNPTIIPLNQRVSSANAPPNYPTQQRANGPTPNSLGAIIGSYKSSVTKAINMAMGLTAPVIWQPRYHDHIIRNTHELARIRNYVANNPARWEADTFFAPRPSSNP